MAERALASIQIVEEIRPIEGRDRIELARIEGWWVIVQKGAYNPGDLIVYFEVDSVLPPDKRWSGDLERYNHRVKIMKMAGVFSQGYTMPLGAISETEWRKSSYRPRRDGAPDVGMDLTEVLGVTKYEPDAWNKGTENKKKQKGRTNPYHEPYPSFIPKTDETRVQKLGGMLKVHEGKQVYITEKMHGSSMTVYLLGDHFGVCSRNLELLREIPPLPWWKKALGKFGFFMSEVMWRKNCETPLTGHFWQMAINGQLEEKLRNFGSNIAIQGEIVGPGICDNIYKLNKHQFLVFSAYDIDLGHYLDFAETVDLCANLNLTMVPILGFSNMHTNVDQWVMEADGQSQIHPAALREGFVVRTTKRIGNQPFSFKAVSQPWLLKHATN